MVLALTVTGIVIVALLGDMLVSRAEEAYRRFKAHRRIDPVAADFDPGRDRRAEARARLLLKSCVNEEEWAMYRDLGFIRVWSIEAGRPARAGSSAAGGYAATDADDGDSVGGYGIDGSYDDADEHEHNDGSEAWWGDEERQPSPARRWRAAGRRSERLSSRADAPYAYLIYPHKPVVAYVPQTGRLLSEHCVEFPDETRPYGSSRLPDSDDVLAKWMALTGDEQRLIDSANMHLPGRQVDPRQLKRDLWRLRQWERERGRRGDEAVRDSRVSAP
ncbi:MAG TPA: hypothetical protein VGM91_07640 [Conexibacter sp.]|jgi:hypothetical protein